MTGMPYFMTNEKWFTYDPEGELGEYGCNYLLTEEGKKDPYVVASYKEFLEDDSI